MNPIDSRHREWLRYVLLNGGFRRVLEVGSYKGYSASAFFDALSAGAVDEVCLCDPTPQPQLLAMIGRHPKRDRIHLHTKRSVEFLATDTAFDFIFVDGLHTEENVLAELELLLPADLDTVAFHDTGSCGRHVACDGPQYAKQIYSETYYTLEDTLHRSGERTERGLFMATKTLERFEVVREGYRRTCGS